MHLFSRTMFVQGVIGICHHCGGEIRVDKDVQSLGVPSLGSQNFVYNTIHGCGHPKAFSVDRDLHKICVEWLQHLAQSTEAPVRSHDDFLIETFRKRLDQIANDEQLLAAVTSDH